MSQYQTGAFSIYSHHDLPNSDILDVIVDAPIDAYDQLKHLFFSILMEGNADSSSLTGYTFVFPTATSLYSFDFLRQIHVEDVSRLSEFLVEHSDVVVDVMLGCQVATEVFGRKTRFNLTVQNDEEMDLKYLVLSAQLKQFEPSILEKIDKISDSYSEDIRDKSTYFIVKAKFE